MTRASLASAETTSVRWTSPSSSSAVPVASVAVTHPGPMTTRITPLRATVSEMTLRKSSPGDRVDVHEDEVVTPLADERVVGATGPRRTVVSPVADEDPAMGLFLAAELPPRR